MTYIANSLEGSKNGLDDPLFNEVAEFCRKEGRVTVATIQRTFKTTFWRASALVKALHDQGFEVSSTTKAAAGIKNG